MTFEITQQMITRAGKKYSVRNDVKLGRSFKNKVNLPKGKRGKS